MIIICKYHITYCIECSVNHSAANSTIFDYTHSQLINRVLLCTICIFYILGISYYTGLPPTPHPPTSYIILLLYNTGEISSKTNIWPISNTHVRNWPNLQSYLFQEYISLNPSRVKQNYTIHL